MLVVTFEIGSRGDRIPSLNLSDCDIKCKQPPPITPSVIRLTPLNDTSLGLMAMALSIITLLTSNPVSGFRIPDPAFSVNSRRNQLIATKAQRQCNE